MSYTPAAPTPAYGQQQQQSYPPQRVQDQPPRMAAPPRGSSNVSIRVPARNRDEFFHHCDLLSNSINVILSNTDQIRSLNQRALGEVNLNLVAGPPLMDEAMGSAVDMEVFINAILSLSTDMKRQVDRICEDTSALVTETRNGIKVLAQSKTADPPASVKNQQYGRIVSKLKDATRTFFTVENEVKASGRDQFARQYRIARPQATDAEIDNAIDNGTSDVFTQELMSSRVADQRRQLNAVQDRAKALQKINESMQELLRIVQELDAEIDKQQVFIDEIQTHVETAAVNAEQGVRQLEQGVRLASSARKKQMWIFIIIFIVLIVIGGVVGIYIATQRQQQPRRN
ncbi:Plasma membrane t-SNARE, secretory vesicle fusion [Dinochytrium kinnereticum]|nr:Plasma membrane t-SNARE, secretory vesicle fusion [Dinochytrium kinnereticum]